MAGNHSEDTGVNIEETPDFYPETIWDYISLPINDQYVKHQLYQHLPRSIAVLVYYPYALAIFLTFFVLSIPYFVCLELVQGILGAKLRATLIGLAIAGVGGLYLVYGFRAIHYTLGLLFGLFFLSAILNNPSNTQSGSNGGNQNDDYHQRRAEKYIKWSIWYEK